MLKRARKFVKGLTQHGEEIPDPTPVAPPLGYKKIPSLAEQIRQAILSEKLKEAAAAAGVETFEEADDFDVGDDYDPRSPYEETFEPSNPAPANPMVEVAETKAVEAISTTGGGSEPPRSEDPPPVPPEAAKRPKNRA